MFLISDSGQCESCEAKVGDKESVTCRSCQNCFHVLCGQADKTTKICGVTFWGLYLTTKANFSWACDDCLTKEEINTASSLKQQINLLTETVHSLRDKIQEPREEIKDIVKDQVSIEFEKLKDVWGNQREAADNKAKEEFMTMLRFQMSEEVNLLVTAASSAQPARPDTPVWPTVGGKSCNQPVKSSLMVKPDLQGNPVDVNKIKNLVVDKGIPVNSINVSSKGETFVNLPNETTRDKLGPLLVPLFPNDGESEEPFVKVVNVKSKLPSVSLLRVEEEMTPHQITERIYKQNENIKTLMDAKCHLSVIFTKPPSGNQKYHQVALRVSPEIRKAIKSYGNKIHVGGFMYTVEDRFYVKRCNRCQQFNHYADKCDRERPLACGYCTENHKSDDCPLRDKHHVEHQCVNCKSADMDFKGHSAFYRHCPSYKIQQNKLKSTISYNYNDNLN